MTEFTRFKGGKLAPKRLMKTPAFGDFLPTSKNWPAVAARGWQYALPNGALEMLGNDQYGDCAAAGAMHLIQVDTANAGRPMHGTLQQTLDLYSAVTGFNPSDPSTDNGTVLLDLLSYWKNEGIKVTDSTGREAMHKILGWAHIDTQSVAQMRYACDIFGGLYVGIQCPQSAEQDTSNWVYRAGSPIMGGHCVTPVGQGSAGGHAVSWGMSIPFTWEFMLHYLDEGYIVVSDYWLNAQGDSPSGLDLNGLLDAMKAL